MDSEESVATVIHSSALQPNHIVMSSNTETTADWVMVGSLAHPSLKDKGFAGGEAPAIDPAATEKIAKELPD
ncbi:hypothetical protein E2562_034437 [Oryza meyeriana var. granulata]|uniref:Uncharacterized protein n=1 Tax=Oryza meyeriana var. granulata TaxID=110450 RepID=A0A6G1FFG1_9ORYZ|nr:hypothetical protein E2562_034437 [Oryza meyeriana var. granulata]